MNKITIDQAMTLLQTEHDAELKKIVDRKKVRIKSRKIDVADYTIPTYLDNWFIQGFARLRR